MMLKSLRIAPSAGLVALLTAAAAGAEYPSPGEAGFHHCALVYDCEQRSSQELAPYVAYLENGSPRSWLFDAFLFLVQRTPSGRRTVQKTDLEDWQYHLDRWFTPGRDLDALEEAITRAQARLGAPPSKRRVVLSIPRPSREATAFGDVDGDGEPEDLSTAAGARTALTWYVKEAHRRFDAAHFAHLELWGFYWMHEAVRPAEEASTRAAAEIAHALGAKLLWIPWFRAPGWDRWRQCGFDVALLQPNYAFFSQHRGRLRRSRLAQTAHLARTHGLGVEMELPMFCNDPATVSYFRRYLADGAASRYGYQAATTAYYLGVNSLERLCHSKIDWQRSLYDAVAAYVRGQTVPDPDPRPTWQVAAKPVPALSDGRLTDGQELRRAEARLARLQHVGAVDVYLDEPSADHAWQGRVLVDVRRDDASSWEAGGWALRTTHHQSNSRWQAVTVPIETGARRLRVQFKPARLDSRPPRVAEIGVDPVASEEKPRRHLAQGLPYRLVPAPAAKYGDSGGELTDGVIPAGGFASGGTVGWHNRGVVIAFDLARVVEIDRIEVHVEGGGYAAVNWPNGAVVLLATASAPAPRFAATGTAPEGLAWLPGGQVVIERQRAPNAADGHIPFQPDAPVAARYATLLLRSNGWLMVSEVRIISAGRNVAPTSRYAFRPAPTGEGTEKYADDGLRLTDGIIAHRFSPTALTGWADDTPRTITIDLGAERPVRRVVTWTLGGGKFGIFAPLSVEMQTSADGRSWQLLGKADRPSDLVEEGRLEAIAYTASAERPVRARMIRVIIRRRQAWAMLSEIVVE